MLSFISPFTTSSLFSQYLNAFVIRPEMGQLTVPQLLHSHDTTFVIRENFRTERAGKIGDGIREAWEGIYQTWPRLLSEGYCRIGLWKAFSSERREIHFEGPGGKLVQWSLNKGEDEYESTLHLAVGYSTPFKGSREDLHVRFHVMLPEYGYDMKSRTTYDFGFGRRSLAGLLRFLDIDGPVENFEWFDRRYLMEALRKRINGEKDRTDRFDADHHGVSWKKDEKSEDRSSGHLWPDDDYSALHVDFSGSLSPLLPGFLPLWEESVHSIRALQARASSVARRTVSGSLAVSDAQPL